MAGFGPFPPEIYHVPFPCESTDLAEVQRAVEQVFKADIEPSRAAAIIFEPVQGEGGFNPIQADAMEHYGVSSDIMTLAKSLAGGTTLSAVVGRADADRAKQVQKAALAHGLLLLTCGVYGNVLRFLFPLTTEDIVFNEALDILDDAFQA
jgi:4-aminobutyrate aminotransferase-like enzyme